MVMRRQQASGASDPRGKGAPVGGQEPPPAPQARFLRACRRLPVDRTPIWLMRQAGRYMKEYRALRERHKLLEIIQTPELSCQVTLQPIEAFDLDAAIIFADILPPLGCLGLKVGFHAGEGPAIANPIRAAADVRRLPREPLVDVYAPTLQAIELTKREIGSLPLIGFSGAPSPSAAARSRVRRAGTSWSPGS